MGGNTPFFKLDDLEAVSSATYVVCHSGHEAYLDADMTKRVIYLQFIDI